MLVSNQVRLGPRGVQPLAGAQLFKRTERSAKGSGVLLNIVSFGAATTGLRLDTEAANEAVAANFHQKSLRDRVLLPGETVSAFVFLTRLSWWGRGTSLTVPVLSLDKVALLPVVVPAPGLDGGTNAAQTSSPAQAPAPAPAPAPGLVSPSGPAAAAAPAGVAMAPPAPPPEPQGPQGPRQSQVQIPNGATTMRARSSGLYELAGAATFANGDRYEGQFLNDRAHGQGVQWYASGDRYEGLFSAGVQSGAGTYHYASGDRYVGSFAGGLRDGAGVHHFTSGDRYEGAFRAGELVGQGALSYANGDRYVGQFANGVRHGRGTCLLQGRRGPADGV